MRGFLGFIVVVTIALGFLAVAAVQFVLPTVASAAIKGALSTDGQPVSVRVTTSFGGVFLHGWIDEVRVDATGVRLGSATAASAGLLLTDVALADRSFARIDGTLRGVVLPAGDDGALPVEQMRLSGSSNEVTAVGDVAPGVLETLLAQRLAPLGVNRDQVRVADGEIRLTIAGVAIAARLEIEGSTLVVSIGGLDPVPIVEPPVDGSWRITRVAISSAGTEFTLVIRGSVLTGAS